MLLGNYSVLNKTPGRQFGGSTLSANRGSWGGNSCRNKFVGGFHGQNGIPVGYTPPYCFVLPQTSGGMSLRTVSTGSITANLIPTRPMEIDLTGAGTFSATASLVVSMLAAFSGSGTFAAAISGRLNATIDLTGTGDLAADMSAVANAVIALSGTGDLDATIAAIGSMTIDIVVTGTGLSTANVGQAVWAALAAGNNEVGSMGEKLNDAGSASNPWTEVIDSGYTAAEILQLLASVAAGKSSGGGTSTIVFRDLADTKNRISATVDSSGNRSALTIDP